MRQALEDGIQSRRDEVDERQVDPLFDGMGDEFGRDRRRRVLQALLERREALLECPAGERFTVKTA